MRDRIKEAVTKKNNQGDLQDNESFQSEILNFTNVTNQVVSHVLLDSLGRKTNESLPDFYGGPQGSKHKIHNREQHKSSYELLYWTKFC